MSKGSALDKAQLADAWAVLGVQAPADGESTKEIVERLQKVQQDLVKMLQESQASTTAQPRRVETSADGKTKRVYEGEKLVGTYTPDIHGNVDV